MSRAFAPPLRDKPSRTGGTDRDRRRGGEGDHAVADPTPRGSHPGGAGRTLAADGRPRGSGPAFEMRAKDVSGLDDMRAHLRAIRTLTKGLVSGIPELAREEDPIALFGRWFEDAEASGLLLPESVALATATPDGRPSVRMVLLKGFDAEGFRFFTNYESRKGEELEANPRAALCIHWSVLERQVRVEGPVERLSAADSEAYFRTRARGSRIGAWASAQSRPLEARAGLEDRVSEIETRFANQEIPCPPNWGGYRVAPHRIEFWQGRADRLHDRLLYEASADGWTVTRLQP